MTKSVVYFFLFLLLNSNVSYSKSEINLEDDPKFTEAEKKPNCNTGRPELGPEDDSIEFLYEIYNEKTDEVTLLNNSPFFNFYSDESLKNVAPVELNGDGLFINKEKVCEWGGRANCESTSKDIFTCDLYNLQNKGDKSIRKHCERLPKYLNGFRIKEITDKFYSILVDKRKYFISRTETPQYKFKESYRKKASALKEKLFTRINKNFKKHQNDFLEFVEEQKRCSQGKENYCSAGAVKPSDQFTTYLCLDKKISCAKKSGAIRGSEILAFPYFWASRPECFNLEKMEIDITDSKDNGKLRVYNVLKGYDRNVICAFDIVLNEKEKDKILMQIKPRIDMESAVNRYLDNEVPDNPNRVEDKFKETKEYEINQRSCNKLRGFIETIPSRLHDKTLQKME
jgi:hypothetical protein